jgi:hypothetical protein
VNITLNDFREQADLGMPASSRVRTTSMASLRALPMTRPQSVSVMGQKCAHIALVDGYAIERGVVATRTFPGTSAWSPPT